MTDLKKLLSISLCLVLTVGVSLAQEFTVLETESPYIEGGKPLFTAIPRANLQPGEVPQGSQVPLWHTSFVYGGVTYHIEMVGTDPAAGSVTSNIPLVIIPLQFVFADGTHLSALQTVCGDTKNTKYRVKYSPLLKSFAFAPGGTNVGTTQYIDAFQRANFWHSVSKVSPSYHVKFSPVSTVALQTITVPSNDGKTVLGPCARIGEVDINYFDNLAQNLITKLGIPASSLPLFLDYNTFWTFGGSCCILGYHGTDNAGVHTYAVAAYSDPNIFNVPIEDIHALSHELGEWMDDPLINNIVPAWGHVGQVGGCQNNLEVGDPVTGHAFTVTLNGFTYHPEDLVFYPWFARIQPSTSVNGWYTFLNEFSSPQGVCH